MPLKKVILKSIHGLRVSCVALAAFQLSLEALSRLLSKLPKRRNRLKSAPAAPSTTSL